MPSADAALPLRFHSPAGWPEPSAWWVATHQGEVPERGWVPDGVSTGGVRPDPAPEDWVWWSRHPDAWRTLTRRVVSQYRRGMIAGALLFVVALGLLFAPFAAHSGLRVLLWGALLYGPAEVARDLMGLTTLGDRYDAYARRVSARLAADPHGVAPTTAQELENLFVPKSGPGNDAPLHTRGRLLTMVVAGALAAVLIVLLADAFVHSTMGSGAH
ncbi:hypothetical protein [Frondihabitans australicus]|uniref:Uncharacterized protein n=1 Tax=Frondihabitans australicus TaxID=386892 RepID=A0A495IL67_9MICO|nr:hypothetical protein [Frondihabitans australicus]RKR76178.1 hypothetical protein C8E83_3343 [Frondihabitans australicus]